MALGDASVRTSGRWSRRRGTIAVLSVLSVAALLVGVVVLGLRLGPPLTYGLVGPSHAMPMDDDIHLDAGRWVILERTGTQRRSGPITVTENDAVFDKVQVRINDPTGDVVDPEFPAMSQTITRNGNIYTSLIGFDARTSGTYHVSLEGSSSAAIIAPDIGHAVGASATWLVVAALGALGCLAGLILFFTGREPHDADAGGGLPM